MSTGYYLLDNPPARSQYRKTRRAKPTGCIVVHTAESILDKIGTDSGAENVARFIQRRSTPGSYHRVGDRDSIVKLIPFSYEAWQDGTGSNAWAIGISLAMQAHTWPDLTMQHRNQLIDTMARMAVEAAAWLETEHGITVPAVRITKAESDAGKPGFIAHGDRDPARRTDPGRHFPWTQFLNRFTELRGEQPMEPDPLVKAAQEALLKADPGLLPRFGADGLFGQETTEAIGVLAGRYLNAKADVALLGQRVADLLTQLDQADVDAELGRAVRALVEAGQ